MRNGYLFVLASLLAGVFAVSGCGDSASDDGREVVTFWTFFGEPAQKKALEERIAAFEKENPTLRVELQTLTYGDGKSKLLAAFNAGTAPDVIELGSDWIAQFSAQGVLADQKTMAGDSIARFSNVVAAPGEWKGGLFAWPWVVDTRVLFVNTGLLAESGVDTTAPDATWDAVLDNAEKVYAARKDQTVYGWGAQGPDEHRLYKKIIPFFWSNGGEILTAAGAPAINSDQNVAALEMYLSLARVGRIGTQQALDDAFTAGKIGYWISGSWLVDKIKKTNAGLRYRVAVLPAFEGGTPMSFAGGQYLAISNATSKKAAAKKLVAFLTSPAQALEFCKAFPGLLTPADLSIASDPFLNTPLRTVFVAQLKNARMTPVHPKWLEIEAAIEDEVGQALISSKPAREALDAAQARIQQIVDEAAGKPMASR